MSLPNSYKSVTTYFEDTLNFLKEYSWMYNYPNTDILINRVFDNISEDWRLFLENLTNEELNSLAHGHLNADSPNSIKIFFDKVGSLKPLYVNSNYGNTTNQHKHFKIGDKKYHEILRLAPIIEQVCTGVGVTFLIDVGTGAGYLSQLMHEQHNYKVIGFEGSKEKVCLAIERQHTLYPSSKEYVKYTQHYITEHSAETMKSIANNLFPNCDIAAMIGLHACADLSITVLRLFTQLAFVKALIVMPCCYHRLNLLDDTTPTEDWFECFPVSDKLTNTYKNVDGQKFLRRYFLRLACQQTATSFSKMSEAEHSTHARNCLYRAILEAAAKEENCKVSRTKRKSNRSALHPVENTFEHYVNRLKDSHVLTAVAPHSAVSAPLIDNPAFKEKMREKWQQHKENCYLVEVLSAFQAAIQSICENVVLLDRVEYLREKGVNCNVRKVTDDRISPRCYALVATKP